MSETRDQRPLICILDASVDVTGALVAARREALNLADRARFLLVLPDNSRIRDIDLPEFEQIKRLPIRPLRKSLIGALTYLPHMWIAGRKLAHLLDETGCRRLQVNDFYLAHSWVVRRLGFRGTIATWLRIDPRRFGPVGQLWLKAAFASSDKLVAVSSFVASTLPAKAGATIIYDPAPDFEVLGPLKGSQAFAFIGNYIEGKGQDFAIEAFHRLAKEFPRAQLRFYGGTMGLPKNTAYRHRLERLAEAGPGAGRIHFLGFAEPAMALRDAVAALNCSASESFSLTCQESSALGRAVIATRSGGPEEIIVDGGTGFLVDVGDVGALADRMERLLTNSTMAKEMGSEGADMVRAKFPVDQFRQQICAIFGLD